MQKNEPIFEKVTYKVAPQSKIKYIYVKVKRIDRNHIKIDAWVNTSAPLSNIIVKARAFHKYNTYQPFGGEVSENVCGWLNGSFRSFVTEWIMPKMLRYTNLNHPCPYTGSIYFKADNVSVDEYAFPLLVPAGRYRLDLYVWDGDRDHLGNISVFAAVSDHRIVIV